MTPKETERPIILTVHTSFYSVKTNSVLVILILQNQTFSVAFDLLASFGRKEVLQSFFWPCGHAATIWPKLAMAAKFLSQNSHFQF